MFGSFQCLLPFHLKRGSICFCVSIVRCTAMFLGWLVFCQPDTNQGHLGRGGNLNWENAHIRLACRQVFRGIFLIEDSCGRAQLTVSHSGSSGLYKKAGFSNHRWKPVSRFPSRSLPWVPNVLEGNLWTPLWWAVILKMSAKGTLSFLSFFWSRCLYSNRKQTRAIPLWLFLLLLLFVTY